MIPKFSLDLSLSKNKSRTWTVRVNEKGSRLSEGWRFVWKNGIATFGAFHECYTVDYDDTTRVHGKAARKVRETIRNRFPDYRQTGRSTLGRLFAQILSLPLNVLAAVVTILTLPLYLIAYIAFVIIASFWMLIAFIAGKLFGRTVKKALEK